MPWCPLLLFVFMPQERARGGSVTSFSTKFDWDNHTDDGGTIPATTYNERELGRGGEKMVV
jgi:hypothetical protein